MYPPPLADIHELPLARAAATEPDQESSPLPRIEYPRIAEVLERLKGGRPVYAPDAQQPEPGAYARTLEAPVEPVTAAKVVNTAVAAEHVVLTAPGPQPTPHEAIVAAAQPAQVATIVQPAPTVVAPAPAELTDDEFNDLVSELTLRETAREALRAKLINFGHAKHHRSTYEWVFLMLAFSVSVLLSAPPLVRIALALHGTQPG